MKPTNLSVITIPPVNIGLAVITKLEIDLMHINYGLDVKTKIYKMKMRSNFSEVEIANIFGSLDNMFLNPAGKKGDYLYFSEIIDYVKKSYNLAFCIHRHDIRTAGIITLYPIKKEKKL